MQCFAYFSTSMKVEMNHHQTRTIVYQIQTNQNVLFVIKYSNMRTPCIHTHTHTHTHTYIYIYLIYGIYIVRGPNAR